MREHKRSIMDTLSVTYAGTHGITIRGPVISAGAALAGFGLDLQSEAAGIADLVVVRVSFTNHDTGLGPGVRAAVEAFHTNRVVEVAFDLCGRVEELVIVAPNVGTTALHGVRTFYRSGSDAAIGRTAVVHVAFKVEGDRSRRFGFTQIEEVEFTDLHQTCTSQCREDHSVGAESIRVGEVNDVTVSETEIGSLKGT